MYAIFVFYGIIAIFNKKPAVLITKALYRAQRFFY